MQVFVTILCLGVFSLLAYAGGIVVGAIIDFTVHLASATLSTILVAVDVAVYHLLHLLALAIHALLFIATLGAAIWLLQLSGAAPQPVRPQQPARASEQRRPLPQPSARRRQRGWALSPKRIWNCSWIRLTSTFLSAAR